MTPIVCGILVLLGRYPHRRAVRLERPRASVAIQIGIEDLRIGVGPKTALRRRGRHAHLERAAPVPVDLQPEFLEVEDSGTPRSLDS
jgi:hypothetical protein